MRHWLLLILICGSIHSSRAEKKEVLAWETLPGCRLLTSPENEGDRFLVGLGDKQFTFRLYWVDAPQSSTAESGAVDGQARYFSITEETVTEYGDIAKRFTRNFLRGEFTVHTRWEDARSDQKQAFFAIVEKDDKFLSNELVANGLARIYGYPSAKAWPDGLTPQNYLSRLKNSERLAQKSGDGIWDPASGSLQVSGLKTLINASENKGATPALQDPGANIIALEDRINVNTASQEELEKLPGIGPALSQRIIAARPILSKESLVEISGISTNTLADFRDRIVVEDPPPPEKTIAFYLANIDQYLDQEIVVVVDQIQPLEIASPKGFRALELKTAFQGRDGGEITTYIPEEFYESFLEHYSESGKEFTGLLYRQDSELVLVYRRK